ncbi:phage tail tip lysozyme [Lactococcus lactis]|uniref:phage tail tip lysozyme n=1 Tax=Lactococcus lactis TaxID=1358 RepID=UPI00288CFBE4|nr:phage tail tip lysozyme [Lactococcus lactis]MDT2909276.1 phage tail tip lysozyme [Lactococcus lactis]MDT2925194.1 phage tail tip lysozyme [Lactococcus lactis]MDT2952053.1 phage tail tip lysozyme [Lactococcus lactis]
MLKNVLKAKFKIWLIGLLTSAGGLILTLIVVVVLIAGFSSGKKTASSPCSITDNPGDNTSVEVNGDWTKKGTSAYESAKGIFDHLTKVNKFSGAGASGAVGVANRESNFNPKAINTSGGVAGYFQWSGFTNTVNGTRITAEGSIKAGDESTLTQENEFKLIDYELKGPKKSTATTVGKATDPKQAAMDWSKSYEGVDLSDPQTKPEQIKNDAVVAYTLFDGASIPSEIGDVVDGDGTTSDNSNTSSDNACGNSDDLLSDSETVNKYLNWMKKTGDDATHGYVYGASHGSTDGPDYDCSSFISWALKDTGVYKGAVFVTTNEKASLLTAGFKDVTSKVDVKTGKGLEPGDILVVNSSSAAHTETVFSTKDGKANELVGAHSDQGNSTTGDQTNSLKVGNEVGVTSYWNDGWDTVLRLTK